MTRLCVPYPNEDNEKALNQLFIVSGVNNEVSNFKEKRLERFHIGLSDLTSSNPIHTDTPIEYQQSPISPAMCFLRPHKSLGQNIE